MQKKAVKKGVWWYIATWFGAGLSPFVSGTVGSLAALPFAYVIHLYLGNFALWFSAFVIFAIGIWASNQYMEKMGGKHDPGEIVVDEVAGMCLLLAAFPLTWQSYLIAFILFRTFDIVKPYPVNWIDKKVEGGMGVMLDDMVAAAYPIAIFVVLNTFADTLGIREFMNSFFSFIGNKHVF